MNRNELVTMISKDTEIPWATVNTVVGSFIKIVTLTLGTDEEVFIRDFGKWVLRTKSKVTRRNPRTGEPMEIPALKTVVFYPSTTMKASLNRRRKRKAA